MRHLSSVFFSPVVYYLFMLSCTGPKSGLLTVSELLAQADSLVDQRVQLEGKVDHICRSSNRRLTLVDEVTGDEIKVEYAPSCEPCDSSLVGKSIEVVGFVRRQRMSLADMRAREVHVRRNHVGEEHTAHFQEELQQILDVIAGLESGAIAYYDVFVVEVNV